MLKTGAGSPEPRWKFRDWLAAAGLFLATARVILWQDAHVAVLWDLSYVLDHASRIALGQLPYRDFPFAHAPLTFLIQAAIIRLTGRVFFHHVLYAATVGGMSTVLTWRLVLHSLRERVSWAWAIALLLAAPLTVLGIYCILPLPSYDCDCAFSILVAVWLLQRLSANGELLGQTGAAARGFVAGAALCVPVFFKQNMGLPFLAAALAAVLILMGTGLIRREKARSDAEGKELNLSEEPEEHTAGAKAHADLVAFAAVGDESPTYQSCPDTKPSGFVRGSSFSEVFKTPVYQSRLNARTSFSAECSAGPEIPVLLAVLGGVAAALLAAVLLLHFTAGLGNYFHWTMEFAAQRRLPGFQDMLGVYYDSTLLWTLPCVAVALLLLRSHFAGARWAQIAAIGLLAAPFLFTLYSLFLYDDANERGDSLLALWPMLLILATALAFFNLCKHRRDLSLRELLPIVLLAAINGTFMSQQLWGSTYAIWPLLVLLIAEMIVFLAGPLRAAEENGNSSDIGEMGSSGAKARGVLVGFMRGLKPPPPSVFPPAGAEQAAERGSCGGAKLAGAKAHVGLVALAARLKPCPDTKLRFAGEASESCPDTELRFAGQASKSCPDTELRLAGQASRLGTDTRQSNAFGGVRLGAFGERRFGAARSILTVVMAAVISVTLLICGGFYTASEERLSYAQFPDAPVEHSTFPQLAGMATPGPYLPNFEELLRFASVNIPYSDGLILLPGEDPFYFVTGRTPQFPVLLFDPATDPYSPAQVVEEAWLHQIRWLVVKRELQIKEDPTPQREATLKLLMSDFTLVARLHGYDVYRR
jgi:hypothetical protein